MEGDAGTRAQVGVHCYSSRDLYNWKDEGIALKVVEGDNSHHIAKGLSLIHIFPTILPRSSRAACWSSPWPGRTSGLPAHSKKRVLK